MEWWAWMAATLGGLAVIASGINAIKTIISPMLKVRERVDALEADEAAHEKDAERQFAKIEKNRARQEETNQIVLKAQFALVNHEIDGNGVETLKAVRKELSDNIIER